MKALTYFVITIVITQVLTVQLSPSTYSMIKANIDATQRLRRGPKSGSQGGYSQPAPTPRFGGNLVGKVGQVTGLSGRSPRSPQNGTHGPHGGPGFQNGTHQGGPGHGNHSHHGHGKNATTGCDNSDLPCLAQWYQRHGVNPNDNGTTLLQWANCTNGTNSTGTFDFACGKAAVKRWCNESGAHEGIEEHDCAARKLAEFQPCPANGTANGTAAVCWDEFKNFMAREKHTGHQGPNNHTQYGGPHVTTRRVAMLNRTSGGRIGRGRKEGPCDHLDPMVEACCVLTSYREQKRCLDAKDSPCDNIDPLKEPCCQK